MTRVKRGVTSHKRHKKLIASVKGYKGLRNNTFKWAKNASVKAGQNSYRGRKLKKRDFRRLWITRINAACRMEDLNYSRLIHGLLIAKVIVDRKILADIAVTNPDVFKKVVDTAKAELK
jgi:large subunit ribosomal protein L20